MERGYRDIAAKLSDDDRGVIDKAMNIMYINGFAKGYVMADNSYWILASKDSPATRERVDITVELADGKRITSKGRFVDGKWEGAAAKRGTVLAWRPELQPYQSDLSLHN